jgi:hypothetical protein
VLAKLPDKFAVQHMGCEPLARKAPLNRIEHWRDIKLHRGDSFALKPAVRVLAALRLRWAPSA